MKRLLTLATIAMATVQTAASARLVGRPDMAVKLAAADCRQLMESDPAAAAAAWYIWIRDSQDRELIDVYDYVLNTALSRADYPIRSTKIEGGTAGTLLRIDRTEWLPKFRHQANFIRLAEQYVDPCFYVESGFEKRELPWPEYQHNGRSYRSMTFNLPVVDFNPAILSLAGDDADFLRRTTGMNVPIVEAERWLVQSLRTLSGGLYYKLQGVDRINGNRRFERLSQNEWLALWGADESESERLGGEEYVGMWRSKVTGKPRRAKFLYGRATRPSVGPPLVVITEDGADEDLETDQHPIYSLFDFEFAATEILATKPNGTIAYGLFNGDGALQDEAPPNVVTDHQIPEPHTSRLEPAISCIRCHAPEGQWRPMPNQVKTLLGESFGGKKLEVIDDLSDPTKSPEDVTHELRALYSGDLTTPLRLARDSHELTTIKMVDFRLEGDGYAVEAAKRVSERFGQYVYDPVGPVEALRTLGVACSADEADRILAKILPVADSSLIDPAIATLRLHDVDETLILNRTDWERVYPAALGTAISYGKFDFGDLSLKESPEPEARTLALRRSPSRAASPVLRPRSTQPSRHHDMRLVSHQPSLPTVTTRKVSHAKHLRLGGDLFRRNLDLRASVRFARRLWREYHQRTSHWQQLLSTRAASPERSNHPAG